MKFKMYVKVKNKYELREIETKGNDGRDFFKRLLLSINEQLAIIRVSMLKFNDNEIKINLRHPHHPDTTINIKLKSLEKIRKLNLITKENLLNLLHENEFIICPQCDRKMIKTPIDTSYIKVDNTFIIKNNKTPVRYSYICENCLNAIDEEAYISLQRNKKTREELLKAGYNFVPNDFGNWHYIDNGKPLNKPPELRDKPLKSWTRKFEDVKVDDKHSYLKITEVCNETNEVKHIR